MVRIITSKIVTTGSAGYLQDSQAHLLLCTIDLFSLSVFKVQHCITNGVSLLICGFQGYFCKLWMV